MEYDWRGNEKILAKLKTLKNTGLNSDLTITLEYLDDNGVQKEKEYKVHKFILHLASCVFEKMFVHELKEKNSITVKDASPSCFDLFITYLYEDSCDIKTISEAWDVFKVAHFYMVGPLKNFCLDFIRKNIDESSAVLSFELADLYELSDIKEHSYKLILNNFENISVKELSEKGMQKIMDEEIVRFSEITLFQKLEEWLSNEIDAISDPVEKEQRMKSLCDKFIRKVHFFEMDPSEFTDWGPYESKFLTTEQKFSIFTNLNSKSEHPLPEGITRFAIKRIILPPCCCVMKTDLCKTPLTEITSVKYLPLVPSSGQSTSSTPSSVSAIELHPCIKINNSNGNLISFSFRVLEAFTILSQANTKGEFFSIDIVDGRLKITFKLKNKDTESMIFLDKIMDGEVHFLSIAFVMDFMVASLDKATPLVCPWSEINFDKPLKLCYRPSSFGTKSFGKTTPISSPSGVSPLPASPFFLPPGYSKPSLFSSKKSPSTNDKNDWGASFCLHLLNITPYGVIDLKKFHNKACINIQICNCNSDEKTEFDSL